MIIGTGIDIVEVARVREKIMKENGFREKVFSRKEIEYCEGRANAFEHFAGKFAAKEALLKASGSGLALSFDLFEIETDHDDKGRPFVVLSGNILDHFVQNDWNKIHLSLSHTGEIACAMVIIEK